MRPSPPSPPRPEPAPAAAAGAGRPPGQPHAGRAPPGGAPADACEDVLGYRVFCGTLGELVEQVAGRLAGAAANAPGRRWLACLNPHSYVVARGDAAFGDALRRATWLVPDGAGIVLGSRILGGSIRTRITGADVFEAVSAAADARGPFSAMFVGSTEATLAAIAARYRRDYPNVGELTTLSPPFRERFAPADVEAIATAVSRRRPDLLWIGLTAPKQELLLTAMADGVDFGFAAAIGAVFDFYAGTVQRTSEPFRRLGLEWLPRLLRQPRRLWRRTFVSAPIFLRDVAAASIRRRIGRA